MKRSKFFCENCGAEVKHNAKVCPHCGRFFEAVRCPMCSFTGDAGMFIHGCPNCGYAASWGSQGGGAGRQGEFIIEPYDIDGPGLGGDGGGGVPPSGERAGAGKRESPRGAWSAGSRRRGGSVPEWVYWLAMGILGLAFGALVIVYLSL